MPRYEQISQPDAICNEAAHALSQSKPAHPRICMSEDQLQNERKCVCMYPLRLRQQHSLYSADCCCVMWWRL